MDTNSRRVRRAVDESRLQKWLIVQMKSAGAIVLNIHGHAYQAPGWPDLYIAHRRFEGWLELKIRPKKVRPLQAKRIQDLKDRFVGAFCLSLERSDKTLWLDDEQTPFRYGNEEIGLQLLMYLQERRNRLFI